MSKYGDLDIPPWWAGCPMVMGWHTARESYSCHNCKNSQEHHSGPGFFIFAQDKELKPLCFTCSKKVAKIAGLNLWKPAMPYGIHMSKRIPL